MCSAPTRNRIGLHHHQKRLAAADARHRVFGMPGLLDPANQPLQNGVNARECG
jgi:hypothetical protein